MVQEAYIGKLQCFVTEVFFKMGASERCRSVPLNPSFAVQYVRRNSCWSYWYCKGYTTVRALEPGRIMRWRSLCSSTSDFQYPDCSVRRRFCPSKKSIWKHGLPIKISLKYAGIASEIPLYITTKSWLVARYTVIVVSSFKSFLYVTGACSICKCEHTLT